MKNVLESVCCRGYSYLTIARFISGVCLPDYKINYICNAFQLVPLIHFQPNKICLRGTFLMYSKAHLFFAFGLFLRTFYFNARKRWKFSREWHEDSFISYRRPAVLSLHLKNSFFIRASFKSFVIQWKFWISNIIDECIKKLRIF